MMYLIRNLCNKLFGWEYVIFAFGYSNYIRRLRRTQDGVEYVHFIGEIVFNEGYRDFKRII